VVSNPTISIPSTATACTSPGTASIASTPTGVTSYQWYKGTSPSGTALTNTGSIGGSTSATLSFTGLTTVDSATQYYVVATGCGGAQATSGQSTLTVNQSVSITGNPTAQSACTTPGTATFTVTATGTGLAYQWRKAGANVSNNATISGATSATLNLSG